MSLLTPEESRLLDELAPNTVRTIGRTRLSALLALVHRVVLVVRATAAQLNEARFHNNAFWLTASGVLGEEQIRARQDLPDSFKADLLSIVQMRYDAEHWREHIALNLPALPSVAEPTEVEANAEIHTAEHIG